MADLEMEKFTKAVEKLCGDCASDVADLIEKWQKAVSDRTDKLADDIVGVPVPVKTPPADLEKIPEQINQIVDKKGAGFKSLMKLMVHIKIDTKARSMRVNTTGYTSPTWSR
jgi:hypothetical protein